MKQFEKAVKETMDVYQKFEAISASRLSEVLVSPMHYKYRYIDGNPRKVTPALAFGALCHTAILEPEIFLKNFLIEPKFTGEGSRKAKKDWEEKLPAGALVMDQAESDLVVGMINAVRNYEPAASILRNGIAEHSLYWTDKATGLPAKCRPDYITEDEWIIDIKTTIDAERRRFMNSIVTEGYHITAAHYLNGYREVFGREAKAYVYVAIEKSAPHPVCVYVADPTVVERGEMKVREGFERLKTCLATNKWPGYQTEAENISLPHWALYEEEK